MFNVTFIENSKENIKLVKSYIRYDYQYISL